MNREDIIRMAREADLVAGLPNSSFSDGIWWIGTHEVGSELEAFAALVASAAQAKEREACAKLCEQDDSMRWSGAANAIRARAREKV